MPCSSRLASTRFAFVQPGNCSAFVPVSRAFHPFHARVVRRAGKARRELVIGGDELFGLVFEPVRRATSVEVVGSLVDLVCRRLHPLDEVVHVPGTDGDLGKREVHAVSGGHDRVGVVLRGDGARSAAAGEDERAGGKYRCSSRL